MIQCAEQKVAEPAPLRIGPSQGAFLQQVDEEILREVLRVMAAVAASADEGVNRIAIKTIELLQGNAGLPRRLQQKRSTPAPTGSCGSWAGRQPSSQVARPIHRILPETVCSPQVKRSEVNGVAAQICARIRSEFCFASA